MNLDDQLKHLDEQRKGLKKLIHLKKQAEGKTLPQKLSKRLDSLTLLICDPFVNRVESIQKKRQDPDGHKADRLVTDAIKVITRLERRIEKGKGLKDKHLDLIDGMGDALRVIKAQELGTMLEEIDGLAVRLATLTTKETQPTNEGTPCSLPVSP